MIIGNSIKRVDAVDKVTGRAKYTDDLIYKNALIAKILHSTIAFGKVKSINLDKALALDGVVKIFTCFDVPKISFPTAGHPWSTDKSHQDVMDRQLLNEVVRYYGDDIAVVIADNELVAEKALKLIEVEYIKYEPSLSIEEALNSKSPSIHQEYPGNIIAHTKFDIGGLSYEEAIKDKKLNIFEDSYTVPTVQHCYMENGISYAYLENGKIVVVASTQIPHILRRVIGQALNLPYGQIKVVKPYIGGGFGGKQDTLYEPLNAWLAYKTGKAVKLASTREETFVNSRVRHQMKINLKTAITDEGRLISRKIQIYSNQGGYASHGHAVTMNAAGIPKQLYQDEIATTIEAYTVYTNLPVGGAMRGYGVPQITFALESQMSAIAKKLNLSDLKIRKINMIKEGFVDPSNGITAHTCCLEECLEVGDKTTDFSNKVKLYEKQEGHIRKGIGMAIFVYKTGVYPIALETSSIRMSVNQDGSLQLQLGATEIGQGADTVFTQMASETIGITLDRIHIVSTQDTDITPYDSGAYASRQSYVAGHAIKKAGLLLKKQILDYAKFFLDKEPSDIKENYVVDADGNQLISVGELSLEAYYHSKNSKHFGVHETAHCEHNTFSFGCSFAEIEIDMKLGKIKILNALNVHDAGIILNPALAEAQVHGGMSMAHGYALTEELLFDPKTGKALNNDFLGYKLPTALDSPKFEAKFVEKYDHTGPYGNKSLGEPPMLTLAPAIRNAVLNATGVEFNQIPLTPERVVTKLKKENLI